VDQKVDRLQKASTGPKSHWKGKQRRDDFYSAGLLILALFVGAVSIIA
jgi:hypothetical protein